MAYVVAKVKYREEEREQRESGEWRKGKHLQGDRKRELGVEKAKDRVRKGKIEWEREKEKEREREQNNRQKNPVL